MEKSQVKFSSFPDKTGIYVFVGENKKYLYIGRATSLRDRIRSYFSKDLGATRGPVIVDALKKAKKIKVFETDSLLEAVIMEANLIKKHKPKYNSKEKDDKSFSVVVITKEEYPRVLKARVNDLERKFSPKSILYVFGPFTQSGVLTEALKIVRRLFPFRDKCKPKEKGGKKCFSAQIGLCPGVCCGDMNKKEYMARIKEIKMLFDGKKKTLIKSLEKKMKNYAKKEKFEEAKEVRDRISALTHIQDITLIKREATDNKNRIEGFDIAHTSGSGAIGVMSVIENSEAQKSKYRQFNIKNAKGGDDINSLKEILKRRFNHPEWQYPSLVVVDGGKTHLNSAKRTIKNMGIGIPVVSVVKDDRHRPKNILGPKKITIKAEREILFANSEAHRFSIAKHRKKMRKSLI